MVQTALLSLLPFSLTAQTTLYWDTNGATAGAGGATPAGTWRTSGSGNDNWSTASAGNAATNFWTADAIAVFSAGADATGSYTVTVSSTQSVDSIQITEGTLNFTSGTLNLTGTTPSINVASGLTATFGTKIGGSNGLVKTGTGTLQLDNTGNSYTGATTVSAGTLAIGTGANILPSTTDLAIASGANVTLLTSGVTQTIATLTGSGGIDLNNNLLKVGDTTDFTYAGAMAGGSSGTLQKVGTGTLTLSGTSTFAGALDVNAGVVVAASSGALGAASSGNDIGSGSALHLTGGIALSETDLTIRGTGVSSTGVLRNLSGNNSLAGTVNVAASTTIASDTGTLTLSGPIDLPGRTLTADGAGNLTLSGSLTGSGGKITKTGTGTLTLSGAGANTIDGTLNFNDGTTIFAKTAGTDATGGGNLNVGDGTGAAGSAIVRLDAANQIADATSLVTVNADGRLVLNNVAETINRLAGTGVVDTATSGHLTLGVDNTNSTFSGTFAGSGILEKQGTGVLTLTGSLEFDGTLRLAGGTLRLNNADFVLGTLEITGNVTIDFAGTASTLSVTSFSLQEGAALTITNWAQATDYFIAQNWTGGVYDTMDAAPMNQVVFNGSTADRTGWDSYDNQIRPNVPEPSTYGALSLGALLGFFAWRRWRARRA